MALNIQIYLLIYQNWILSKNSLFILEFHYANKKIKAFIWIIGHLLTSDICTSIS